MARDQDIVSGGFGTTGGYPADCGLDHLLHRDPRSWIHFSQIVNELGKILDLRNIVLWKEEHSHGQIRFIFNMMSEFFRRLAKEREGDLGEDARAVASLHIGLHGPALSHAAHGSERVIKDLITAFSLQRGDDFHPAVGVFLGKLVQ